MRADGAAFRLRKVASDGFDTSRRMTAGGGYKYQPKSVAYGEGDR